MTAIKIQDTEEKTDPNQAIKTQAEEMTDLAGSAGQRR